MDTVQLPIGIIIKRTNEMLKRCVDISLQEDDLTHVQAHLLRILHSAEDQTMTFKELESQLAIAQSTVVGLVTRLEKKELVESFRDDRDKRVKRLRLTEKGIQHCEIAHQSALSMDQLLVSDMTASE